MGQIRLTALKCRLMRVIRRREIKDKVLRQKERAEDGEQCDTTQSCRTEREADGKAKVGKMKMSEHREEIKPAQATKHKTSEIELKE